MSLAELSNVLWRQRQLLDLLLFRMTVEQNLLVSRQVRWLARATDEVEAVLEEMRESELVRAVVVGAVSAELGLRPDPSLLELVGAAPAPWSQILDEHRRAFLGLTEEVQAIAASNRELLGREQRATRELLDDLASSTHGRRHTDHVEYGRVASPTGSVVLDQVF